MFIEQRNKLIRILEDAGCDEVLTNRSKVPGVLPAGIVSIKERIGKHAVGNRFASYEYTFELVIIIEDNENSEAQIIEAIERTENYFSQVFYKGFSRVVIDDAMMDAMPVKFARIEVTV